MPNAHIDLKPAPLIMGILNVTPDSFSDGGQFLTPDAALKQVERLVEEGADIIDVGGESTRPGAEALETEQELERVIPIIAAIKARFPTRISVDTYKAEVAEAAIAAGASLINDVRGGESIGMGQVVAKTGVEILLMHMRGTPVSMQVQPLYSRGVVEETRDYLVNRVRAFGELGVPASKIWIDPGIGFGKTLNHNLEILRRLEDYQGIGHRVAIGTSRKSMIAQLANDPHLEFEDRLPGTLATNLWAASKGASVFRVHDVREMKRALAVWRAIENAR